MCRAKSDAAYRRCDCDTSEDRRLRRYNNTARNKYSKLLSKLLPEKLRADSVDKESQSPEAVRVSLIEQIDSLNDIDEEINDAWITNRFTNKRVDAQALFLKRDKALNHIGEGIEFIAEAKYGAPTNLKFQAVYNDIETLSREYRETARRDALQSGMSRTDAETHAAYEAYYKFLPKRIEFIGNLVDQRNDAIRKALVDVGVRFANPETIEYDSFSDDQTLNSLKEALRFYPQSWVNQSNMENAIDPLHIHRMDNGRPYYEIELDTSQKGDVFARFHSELYISRNPDSYFRQDDGMEAAIHEFGHRIEHVNFDVTGAEDIFLRRRVGLIKTENGPDKPEQPEQLYPNSAKAREREERAYRDHFPSHYMGKTYSENYYRFREIFTMGMETLFAGTNGAFAGIDKYSEDTDYKRFMLGLLASSAKINRQAKFFYDKEDEIKIDV